MKLWPVMSWCDMVATTKESLGCIFISLHLFGCADFNVSKSLWFIWSYTGKICALRINCHDFLDYYGWMDFYGWMDGWMDYHKGMDGWFWMNYVWSWSWWERDQDLNLSHLKSRVKFNFSFYRTVGFLYRSISGFLALSCIRMKSHLKHLSW